MNGYLQRLATISNLINSKDEYGWNFPLLHMPKGLTTKDYKTATDIIRDKEGFRSVYEYSGDDAGNGTKYKYNIEENKDVLFKKGDTITRENANRLSKNRFIEAFKKTNEELRSKGHDPTSFPSPVRAYLASRRYNFKNNSYQADAAVNAFAKGDYRTFAEEALELKSIAIVNRNVDILNRLLPSLPTNAEFLKQRLRYNDNSKTADYNRRMRLGVGIKGDYNFKE